MTDPNNLHDLLAARLYVSRETAKQWFYECCKADIDPWLRHIVLAEAAEVMQDVRRSNAGLYAPGQERGPARRVS